MKVLFICNQNQNRSKKAELLFKDKFETKSAGLYNQTPVTSKQLEWADLIIVMEEIQRKELSLRFPKEFVKKRILNADIPDVYGYHQEELSKVIQNKVSSLI